MKTSTLILLLTAALAPGSASVAATNGPTTPVGYASKIIAAGNGSTKKVTPVSAPLEFIASAGGRLSGTLSGVTATTLSNSAAGWTAGELSTSATPHLLKLTGGAAAGRTFLLSTSTANTATTVTIDPADAAQGDLTALGVVAGDTYEISRCDTLLSLFGTPATTGILGGTTSASADSLQLAVNGVVETYFYSTTQNRWTQATSGNPDASNTPIRADQGVLYARLGAIPLELTITGRVPATARAVVVKNSGVTLLSHSWPAATTLAGSQIAQISGWTSNNAAAAADKVKIYTAGTLFTYWFDGVNWRKQVLGSPLSNEVIIPAGSAVTLEQIGSQAGHSTLTQTLPYPLN
jgi:hypothetical protein